MIINVQVLKQPDRNTLRYAAAKPFKANIVLGTNQRSCHTDSSAQNKQVHFATVNVFGSFNVKPGLPNVN